MRACEELVVASLNGEPAIPGILVHGDRGPKVFVWRPRDDSDEPFMVQTVEWDTGRHMGSDGSVNDPFHFVFLNTSGEFNELQRALDFARTFAMGG